MVLPTEGQNAEPGTPKGLVSRRGRLTSLFHTRVAGAPYARCASLCRFRTPRVARAGPRMRSDSGGMEATRRPSWSGFAPARTLARSCGGAFLLGVDPDLRPGVARRGGHARVLGGARRGLKWTSPTSIAMAPARLRLARGRREHLPAVRPDESTRTPLGGYLASVASPLAGRAEAARSSALLPGATVHAASVQIALRRVQARPRGRRFRAGRSRRHCTTFTLPARRASPRCRRASAVDRAVAARSQLGARAHARRRDRASATTTCDAAARSSAGSGTARRGTSFRALRRRGRPSSSELARTRVRGRRARAAPRRPRPRVARDARAAAAGDARVRRALGRGRVPLARRPSGPGS